MTKLTALEHNVLECIDHNEYGDSLCDNVWTFSVAGYFGGEPNQLSGVVSSLIKKGFINATDTGDDASIGMTDAGAAAYLDHPDTEASKQI